MAEELVWQVLRENNIVLAKETLYFYMKMLLEKHEDSYKFMLCRVGRDNVFENLCLVYEESQPVNFGRVMAYLTLVYKVSDCCDIQTFREAVRITVEDLKQIDLASYEIKPSWTQKNQ